MTSDFERDYMYILRCDQTAEDEERRATAAEHELYDHYRQIQMKQEENEFLAVVATDYKRHLEHIRGEKQRQHDAIRGLLDYIERLTSEMDAATHILKDTAYDQKALLSEIVDLKQNIDMELSWLYSQYKLYYG